MANFGDRTLAVPGTAYYVAGDRYPADSAIEEAICTRLASGLPDIRRQQAWQGTEPLPAEPEARRDRLAAAIGAADDAIVIGRSSGGRVATLLAAGRKVHAVICFCYPFQPPRLVLEPARYAHLAGIAAPVLIFQGTADEYGGLEITERYRFSPTVHLRFLPGVTHDFALAPAGWDRVAALVRDFIAAPSHPAAPVRELFDEADYLRRHPGVAERVAAGRLASGHAHYLRRGRAEGRRFRQLPLAGDYAEGASGDAS